MRSNRPDKTLVDYMAIAISPALIMVLVGSLAFFLLTVFYRGAFEDRLNWIMGCFVFAAVLIARISMEEGAERASLYGACLAMAVGLAMAKFLDNPLLSWVVLAIIWFCAHELTWNCTLIDESADSSGEGLLQVAGLEETVVGSASADADRAVTDEKRPTTRRQQHGARNAERGTKTPQRESRPDAENPLRRAFNWFTYRRERNAPPGLYVVYFSLAALPIFGFGQLLLPPLDLARRQSIYWLVFWYVASALGLLLTTSFLGLRRYLRQRKLPMPAEMAGMWLAVGAAMIVAMLVVAAIIPRPNPEYAISALSGSLTSPHLNASRARAPLEDSPAEDSQKQSASQAPATEETPPEAANTASTDRPGSAESKSGQKVSDPQGQEKSGASGDKQGNSGQPSQGDKPSDRDAGKGNSNDNRSGESKSDSPQNASGADQTKSDGANDQKNSEQEPNKPQTDHAKSDQKSPSNSDASDNENNHENKTDATRDETSESPAGKQEQQSPTSDASSRAGPAPTSPPPRPPSQPWFTPPAAGWLLPILKGLLYLAIIIVVLYFLVRHWAEVRAWLSRFWQELLDFWNSLFNARRRQGIVESPQETAPESRPFAAFQDPFASGTARGVPVEELVRYTFEALEAWAQEHGLPRSPDETPLEFSSRVGEAVPAIADEICELAGLYAHVAYARQSLPASCHTSLSRCWRVMRETADQGVGLTNG